MDRSVSRENVSTPHKGCRIVTLGASLGGGSDPPGRRLHRRAASTTLSPCIPALVAQIPAARAPIVMRRDYPNHKALSHHIAAPRRRFYEGEWPLLRSSGSRLRRPGASTSATPAPPCSTGSLPSGALGNSSCALT